MSKLFIRILLLLNFITLALIPIDLFVMDVPSAVCVLMSCLVFALDLYGCLKGKTQQKKKVLISILSVLTIIVVNVAGFCYPYWNSTVFKNDDFQSKACNDVLTSREAAKDLDVFWKHLNKVHPACYGSALAKLQSAYEEAKSELANKKEIKVYEFARILEGIASQLGDAHTYVKPVYEDAHYSRFNYPHNIKGDTMIKVNGKTMYELLQDYPNRYSYESEEWGCIRLRKDLGNLEGLTYLGIDTDEGVTYTFADKNGMTTEEVAYTKDFMTYQEMLDAGICDEEEQQPFCSYIIDENKSLALFTLTECNYTSEYKQCVQEMFSEVKSKNIQNVAVDIRDNGGGSSLVVNEFFKYLDIDSYMECGQTWRCGPIITHTNAFEKKNSKKENDTFSGKFYLLTSYESFSSAMFFAEYVKDNQVGTIIGESPANDPNGYGDVVHFKLPNSGFFMQTSSKKWERIDQETTDVFIEPDIKCDAKDAIDVLYETVQ